jgi:hypothetical protein
VPIGSAAAIVAGQLGKELDGARRLDLRIRRAGSVVSHHVAACLESWYGGAVGRAVLRATIGGQSHGHKTSAFVEDVIPARG